MREELTTVFEFLKEAQFAFGRQETEGCFMQNCLPMCNRFMDFPITFSSTVNKRVLSLKVKWKHHCEQEDFSDNDLSVLPAFSIVQCAS